MKNYKKIEQNIKIINNDKNYNNNFFNVICKLEGTWVNDNNQVIFWIRFFNPIILGNRTELDYELKDLKESDYIFEKILCSAINYNGAIITGRRHSDCYKSLKSILEVESYSNINFDLADREHQGFLTTFNRFVDRKEAYKIAKAQNQIKYGFDATENGEESILISENLFNPEIE